MSVEPTKYEKIDLGSDTESEGGRPAKIEQSGYDVKLGQLEVATTSLKEKLNGDFAQLNQKVDGYLELKKWFIIALVTIFGIIVAVIFGVSNIINSTMNYQKDIQRDYYELLLQNQNSINNLSADINTKEACLQKDYYWEYKNCLLDR